MLENHLSLVFHNGGGVATPAANYSGCITKHVSKNSNCLHTQYKNCNIIYTCWYKANYSSFSDAEKHTARGIHRTIIQESIELRYVCKDQSICLCSKSTSNLYNIITMVGGEVTLLWNMVCSLFQYTENFKAYCHTQN